MTMFDNTESSALCWGFGLPVGVASTNQSVKRFFDGAPVRDDCIGCGNPTASEARLCTNCSQTHSTLKDGLGKREKWVAYLPRALAGGNVSGLSGLYVRMTETVPAHMVELNPTANGRLPLTRKNLMRVLCVRGLVDVDTLTIKRAAVAEYLASGQDEREAEWYARKPPEPIAPEDD